MCMFYLASHIHQKDADAACGQCAHCADKCCAASGICSANPADCTKLGSTDCRSAESKYPDPVVALPKIMDHLVQGHQRTLIRSPGSSGEFESLPRDGSKCGWMHLRLPMRDFPSLCPIGQWCDTRAGTCTSKPPDQAMYESIWYVKATEGTESLEAALMSHLEERRRAGAWLGLPSSAQTFKREGQSCRFSEQGFNLCNSGEICDMWTEECVDLDTYRCAPMEWACFVAVNGAGELERALMFLIQARLDRLDHRVRLKARNDNGQCKVTQKAGPRIPIPKILWWNNCDMHDPGQKTPNYLDPTPLDEECPVPCLMTDNLQHLDDVDGVIIRVDYCMGNAGLNPEEVRLGLDLPPRRKIGQTWMAYSSENPYNYPRMADRQYMQHFNYSSFQSLSTDFPVDYAANIKLGDDAVTQIGLVGSGLVLPWTELATPVPFEKKTGFASYIFSNCDTPSKRDIYTQELMKHIQVDSFGRCLQNKNWPTGMQDGGMQDPHRESNKDAVMGSYKFELAFQNARCDDEIDEKMLQTMRRGVVPVYMGAPNIHQLKFPANSFIHAGVHTTAAAISFSLALILSFMQVTFNHQRS